MNAKKILLVASMLTADHLANNDHQNSDCIPEGTDKVERLVTVPSGWSEREAIQRAIDAIEQEQQRSVYTYKAEPISDQDAKFFI